MMRDEQHKILYIGKAKCLRFRVASYFHPAAVHPPKIARMIKLVTIIEVIETPSEVDALITESRLIKQLQPKYNTRQKDSKSYPYLVVSIEDFPRVFIAREHEKLPPEDYKIYGPFIDVSALKASLKLLQRIFQFRTCNLKLATKGKQRYRPCLLASISYCTAPCTQRISSEAYHQDIDSLIRFLDGDRQKLVEKLEKEMQQAAKNWQFERAAKLRDQLKAIAGLDKCSTSGDFVPGQFLHWDPYQSLEMLQEILGLDQLPRVIEGIDIAHHAGREAVGSLVAFVDGIPYKQGYRRYRIQGPQTNNDYLMLQEVLTRRFCGQDQAREHPDIVLVDGGKGQLNAIMRSLSELELMLPAVVSLAKKQEAIYIPGKSKPLALAKHSPVHHLLCYVRDEAHRFAQSYHHNLQRQTIRKKGKTS